MIPHHRRGPRTDIIIVPTCMVDSDGDADIDEAGRRVGGPWPNSARTIHAIERDATEP